MTLNDLKRRNSPYFFTEFDSVAGRLCHSGWRCRKVFRIGTVRYHWPMSAHASQAFQHSELYRFGRFAKMSAKYRLPVPFFHFWPKLTHPAARSVCDSWASCILMLCARISWGFSSVCFWTHLYHITSSFHLVDCTFTADKRWRTETWQAKWLCSFRIKS